MRSRRTVVALTAALAVAAVPSPAMAQPKRPVAYTVLAASQITAADAVQAIERAGGAVLERNEAVGMFSVVGPEHGFVERVNASSLLAGVARKVPIGRTPAKRAAIGPGPLGARTPARPAAPAPQPVADAARTTGSELDPFDDLLWGLQMVRGDRARRVEAGDRRVRVGIMDTGLDASHPDLAGNFSWSLSRNFAPDLPEVDGECEVPSCLDPVGTDDNGHGTHIAGTVAAAANGFGVSGIAPGATLVELKVGQDSGFMFLEPVVNALTYAGDVRLNIVNMSFFVDPWLFNCVANPADSPAAQAQQRTTILAMRRALTYAHRRGVTLIASIGNESMDLGQPRPDLSSPDFPAGSAYPRSVDNSTCLIMPAEGPFVISVAAVGPSQRKPEYSNYGTEQVSVAAPGGWFSDGFGTSAFQTAPNLILSAYPRSVLEAGGLIDEDGNVIEELKDFVLRQCTAGGTCGYYAYVSGTSMAAPHATGVAALIVSRFGRPDPSHPQTLRLDPDTVESILLESAREHACPIPRLQTYQNEGAPPELNAFCAGGREFNGFYGFGIVDAFAAVTSRR